MQPEHVDQVATPGNHLPIGHQFQAGHIDDRAAGLVFAGNPLRVRKNQRAGLHRHLQMGMQDFLRRASLVHFHADGPGRRLRPELHAGKQGE